MPEPALTVAKAIASERFVDLSNSSVATQNSAFRGGPGMIYNVSYGGWLLSGAGNFRIDFNSDSANTPLKLVVYHCTSSRWPSSGFSPVNIKVNGVAVAANYDPGADHNGNRDYVLDQFVIPANAVRAGANTLTFDKLPGANTTNYWIRTVRITATP